MTRTTLFTRCLTACSLAFAATAFAAGEHHGAGDDHKPKHGGVVAATKLMDYELVAKRTVIHLYLRDHGKPAKVDGASAKLTLLSGSEKQEVELKPEGDKLAASGSFKLAAGTKAVAVVSLAGKPAGTARFTLK